MVWAPEVRWSGLGQTACRTAPQAHVGFELYFLDLGMVHEMGPDAQVVF